MMSKLVIKMELLPHTEEILIQNINAFGYISTRKVKIDDLEHTTIADQYGEDSLREKSARGLVNRDVVFRNKVTNELLLFDPNGIWSEEGIRHVLLA
jgi:hypothetical protein